jgi:hypothetical protein
MGERNPDLLCERALLGRQRLRPSRRPILFYDDYFRYADWLGGFVSATNWRLIDERNQIESDPAATDIWIRKWCEQNPTKPLVGAATAFVLDQRKEYFQSWFARQQRAIWLVCVRLICCSPYSSPHKLAFKACSALVIELFLAIHHSEIELRLLAFIRFPFNAECSNRTYPIVTLLPIRRHIRSNLLERKAQPSPGANPKLCAGAFILPGC